MKLDEIIQKVEEIAPFSISDEYCSMYGHYDNSGVILNSGKEIKGILFSLDFSLNAIKAAINGGYNLIITHHPAIFSGIKSLDVKNDALAEKLAMCIKNDISVVSAHLNLDAAEEGIDYYLMRGMGGTEAVIMDKLSQGGYGRLYQISVTAFLSLCQQTEKIFNSQKCRFYGDPNKEINRVASFCGAGTDDGSIDFAIAGGADVLVSSEIKHHHLSRLLECGICVIELTHYASEFFGFSAFFRNLKNQISIPCGLHVDKNLL